MDPVTHTMTGAALAGSGLRRTTPLATATLIIAANAPDVDMLAYAGGEYAALAFRRGWSHGPVGWLVLPLVVTALVLGYDRWVRRRRAGSRPARAGPLLALAYLGVLTHPALDWLNTYGIRLLMPFDGRWFYGDALFIVDPWIWLALGGALFLLYSRSTAALIAWTVFAAAATLLIYTAPIVPESARLAWLGGLVLIVMLRIRPAPERAGAGGGPRERTGETAAREDAAPDERTAEAGTARGAAGRPATAKAAPSPAVRTVRWALTGVVVYIAAMIASNGAAERLVRAELAAAGVEAVEAVMVAPVPANPFAGSIVARTPDAYRFGEFDWYARERVRIDPDPLPLRTPGVADDVIAAARRAPAARDFLVWSRFPFYGVERMAEGWRVRVGDARYAGERRAGSLAGVTVYLDEELRPFVE